MHFAEIARLSGDPRIVGQQRRCAMIAIGGDIDGLKSEPRWTQADLDDGLTARLLRAIWHAFRDGAAMYAASYCGAPDPGIGPTEPGDKN
jgi:hypothetical protein